MASTHFIDRETLIQASWLNDVDAHVYDQESVAHQATNINYTPRGTDATERSVETKLRESVSVFDFMTAAQVADVQSGAASLDVTAAIQAAISNSGFIYVPTGTYVISETIIVPSNTVIYGDGINNSVFKRKSSTVIPVVLVSDPALFGNTAVCENIVFKDVSINCNATNNAAGDNCAAIQFNDVTTTSSNISVLNCEIFDFGTTAMGIQIAGYYNVNIDQCYLHDGGGDIYYHPIYLRRAGKVHVTNNIVDTSVDNACIKVEPLLTNGKVVISGNITTGGQRGIVLQSLNNSTNLDAVITNNVIKNTTQYGILHSKDTGGTLIQANLVVSNNVISACGSGISIISVENTTVTGNTIDEIVSSGVEIKNSTFFSIIGNVLIGSSAINAGGLSLIYIPSGSIASSTGLLDANVLRNNASSGTRYGINIQETNCTNISIGSNVFSGTFSSNITSSANDVISTLTYTQTLSEVNYPTITTSTTGNPIQYGTNGSDTNIGIRIKTKGIENIWIGNSYGDHLRVGPGSAVVANYLQALGSISGSSVTVGCGGTDTNIGISFAPKGTGKFTFKSESVPTYADDTAAGSGGLTAGQIYKTSSGVLMIKL